MSIPDELRKLVAHFGDKTAYPLFVMGLLLFGAGLEPTFVFGSSPNPIVVIGAWVSGNIMIILGTTVRIAEYVYGVKEIGKLGSRLR